MYFLDLFNTLVEYVSLTFFYILNLVGNIDTLQEVVYIFAIIGGLIALKRFTAKWINPQISMLYGVSPAAPVNGNLLIKNTSNLTLENISFDLESKNLKILSSKKQTKKYGDHELIDWVGKEWEISGDLKDVALFNSEIVSLSPGEYRTTLIHAPTQKINGNLEITVSYDVKSRWYSFFNFMRLILIGRIFVNPPTQTLKIQTKIIGEKLIYNTEFSYSIHWLKEIKNQLSKNNSIYSGVIRNQKNTNKLIKSFVYGTTDERDPSHPIIIPLESGQIKVDISEYYVKPHWKEIKKRKDEIRRIRKEMEKNPKILRIENRGSN